jgi:hypothetical protein
MPGGGLLINDFEVWYTLLMSHHHDETSPERVFSLFEANQLIPKLQSHLAQIQGGKSVVLQTREQVKKAAAQAGEGGGTPVGALYVKSLQTISTNLQAIHELGVLIKDIDLGLCDFPYLRDGRVVYLCWKLGEQQINWWHEVTSGYKDRCPIEDLA